jgi:hypothetical protein
MFSRQVLLAVLAALSVSAVPLNINLGAYSPALVVGDGEISFGNNPAGASELLQTLASGAATGTAANAGAARAPAQAATQGTAGTTIQPSLPAAAAEIPQPAAAAIQPSVAGIASPLVAPAASAASTTTVDANVEAPAVAVEGSEAALPAEFISHAVTGNAFPNMAKRSVTIDERSIHERSLDADHEAKVNAAKEKIRRDLQGFNAALSFARDAQKNQPKVELGFGITQNAGVNVATNSAANGQLPAGGVAPREKRDIPVTEDKSDKLGMTLIAISEI